MTRRLSSPVDAARGEWYKPRMPDADIDTAAELQRYVARAMHRHGCGIAVSFDRGSVTLDGHAASATHARAIEDLVAAHDGVTSVVSRLRVAAASSGRPRASTIHREHR